MPTETQNIICCECDELKPLHKFMPGKNVCVDCYHDLHGEKRPAPPDQYPRLRRECESCDD